MRSLVDDEAGLFPLVGHIEIPEPGSEQGRGDDDPLCLAERQYFQRAWMAAHIIIDPQIILAGEDAFPDVVAVEAVQLDLYGRSPLHEIAEQGMELVGEQGFRNGHTQLPAQGRRIAACRDGLHGMQDGFHVRQDVLAGRGKDHASPKAFEQSHGKLVFELAYLKGHCGLGAVEPLCGLLEAAFFQDGLDDDDAARVHAPLRDISK